jgi:hypothetical protein
MKASGECCLCLADFCTIEKDGDFYCEECASLRFFVWAFSFCAEPLKCAECGVKAGEILLGHRPHCLECHKEKQYSKTRPPPGPPAIPWIRKRLGCSELPWDGAIDNEIRALEEELGWHEEV